MVGAGTIGAVKSAGDVVHDVMAEARTVFAGWQS